MRKGIVVDVTAAGLARRYAISSAPPPLYWGWDVGGGDGTVLAVAGGSEPAASRTRMSSTATPSTAASAVRGSAPCSTSSFDQLVWPRRDAPTSASKTSAFKL